VSKKIRGNLKSRAVQGRTPAQKAARRRRARNRRAQAAAAAPAPPAGDKVPQNQEQNAKQAQEPAARSLGASVNGHGSAGGAQTTTGQAEKLAAIGEQGHRMRTRGVVYEMLGDGSLLEGIERALRANARERFAEADVASGAASKLGDPGGPVLKPAEDRRYRGNTNQVSPAAPPPMNRYNQFLDAIDIDTDKISSLIAALEDRLSFMMYDGPSESSNSGGASTGTSIGPTNRLETELHDRGRRLAIIVDRLTQLHTNLRI